MIKRYNQFINESNGAQNPLSIHEKINEPFTAFIEKAQERLNNFTEHIAYLLDKMDKAIGEVMEDFEYAVVGEPEITVASDLEEIEVFIHTNIPNNDAVWEADESPAQELETRLNKWFANDMNVNVDIYYKPDEDGNCVIALQMYVINEDIFDDFTDPLKAFGLD